MECIKKYCCGCTVALNALMEVYSSVASSPSHLHCGWQTLKMKGPKEVLLKRKHSHLHDYQHKVSIDSVFALSNPIFLLAIFLPFYWRLSSLQITNRVHHFASGVGQAFSCANTRHDLHVISSKRFPFENTSVFWRFPCWNKARTLYFKSRVFYIEYTILTARQGPVLNVSLFMTL